MKDKTCSAQSQFETMVAKNAMQLFPRLRTGHEELRQDVRLEQSQHGLARGARRLSRSRDFAMGDACQAVLCLKLDAGLHEAALVVIGLDAAKAVGMNLVDRDMKVKMACIEMRGRQPLMAAKPDPLAQDAFNICELRKRRPLAGRKGNYEMVGAIALGALVHGLGRQNFLQR